MGGSMNVESVVTGNDANTPLFMFDLRGRVRNMSLPVSANSALVPLFEAVSNSLHAVDARFPDSPAKDGVITIEVLRRTEDESSEIVGFAVKDNGIGLTDENMESFRTSDSAYKLARGGKGVGRLTWLKAFQDCHVTSTFQTPDGLQQRNFSFSLAQSNPISKHLMQKAASGSTLGTEVSFAPFLNQYASHCPKKAETIAAKIVGHFLNYFVTETLPRIVLLDTGASIDLRTYYTDNQRRNDVSIVTLPFANKDEVQEFHLYHVMLRKQLRFLESGGLHWMFQAANQRVVKQDPIDGQLGLKYVGEDADCVYIGLVVGNFRLSCKSRAHRLHIWPRRGG